MKTKILLSLIAILGCFYLSTLPLANSVAVDQFNDTVASTSNVTLVTTLLGFWWLYLIVILFVIWFKNIAEAIKKLGS